MHLLTPPEAAKLLHLSPSTLAKMRLTGRGPRYRKHGKSVVYASHDLENWSDGQARNSTSDLGQKRTSTLQ